MNEILGSFAFVMDRLTGSIPSNAADTLHGIVVDRVYQGIAPSKATYPLVVVQSFTSRDNLVVGGDSAFVTADLLVKVVGTGGYEVLGEADDAIFALLQRAAGPVDESIWCLGVYRVNTLTSERSEGDTIYRTLQSTWRIRIQRIAA